MSQACGNAMVNGTRNTEQIMISVWLIANRASRLGIYTYIGIPFWQNEPKFFFLNKDRGIRVRLEKEPSEARFDVCETTPIIGICK